MECKHQFALALQIISHSLTHYNLMNCGILYPPSVKLFNLLKMLPAHLCHPGNILLLLSEHLDSCTNKSDEFWELFVQSLCFCRIFESSWVSRFYEPNLLAGFRSSAITTVWWNFHALTGLGLGCRCLDPVYESKES